MVLKKIVQFVLFIAKYILMNILFISLGYPGIGLLGHIVATHLV